MAYFRCGGTDPSVLLLPTIGEASGAIARFNTDLTENLLSAVADFSASQASGTPPTPSAPIPIVGVDKVNFARTGKNIFNPNTTENEWVSTQNVIGTSPDAKSMRLKCTQGDSITISCINATSATNILLIVTLNSNGEVTSRSVKDNGDTSLTKTASTNDKEFLIAFYNYGNTGGGQVEIGNQATAYEPYNGTTALINLGGTYYGGSVDAVTGKIPLTHQFYNSLGTNISNVVKDSSSWRVYYSSAFYGTDNQYKEGLCDSLGFKTSYNEVNGNNNSIGFNASAGNQILIRNDTLTSEQEVRDFMATLDVVYPLATPIVVYASNTAEIPTIVGENQVFADSGNIAVKYQETVGHKIS